MNGFDPVYGVTHYKTYVWMDMPFMLYEAPVQAKTGKVFWDGSGIPISRHGSLEEVELVLAARYGKKLGEKFWDSRDITDWKTEDL